MTFRAFSIGFSAALLALACGSEDGNNQGGDDPVDPNEPPAAIPDPQDDCDINPLDVSCGPNPGAPPVSTGEPPVSGDEPPEVDLVRANVEAILAENCGQCHGANLDEEDAEAGMNFITDLDRLAEEEKLVPLNADESLIIQRMRNGTMPPGALDKVPPRDIDAVADYINNPDFWPNVVVEDCSDSGQNIDFDQLFDIINDDLSGEDADDQINYRYLVLTNRYNAGVCDDTSLDRDRQSLVKMVNMLSINPSVEVPLAVDPNNLVYRIDLRDYDWDRAITVEGENFNDVWEAIAANNQYAVPFVGDDADEAVADTGTAFPFMFADTVNDVATIGNLYYAIIDVDVNDTLDNFILNDLGIDVVANLDEEELIRAGTSDSVLSRQDMVAERHDIQIRDGAFWQRFDFADDQNESIYENPFEFQEAGREAIFTLPNGMFGYIIADADGVILEDSDILLDFNQNNFRVTTATSCSYCHAQGFIAFEDQVRETSLNQALGFDLNNDEVEALREVYPEAEEFKAQIDEDTQRFYRAALQRADLPVSGTDPVSSVYLRFDLDLDLADVAGDLGVTPESLERDLRELDPAVQVVDSRPLDRDDFTQFYVNSLCILSIVLENAPDQAVCDEAQAIVDGL
jgi:mono/diheme cytochrome c family protein